LSGPWPFEWFVSRYRTVCLFRHPEDIIGYLLYRHLSEKVEWRIVFSCIGLLRGLDWSTG